MLKVTDEMEATAMKKKLKGFASSEGHIAYTAVFTDRGCTTVLAVGKKGYTEASKDRSGEQTEDWRSDLGEMAHFSTMMVHDNLTKPLVCPMKVKSRTIDNYPTAMSELPDGYGDSMENVCYATAILQPGSNMAQLGETVDDTRKVMPYVMLYRVYQADEFSRLMKEKKGGPLSKCEDFTQSDGTIRVITMVPYLLFVNWYVLLPCTGFVVD